MKLKELIFPSQDHTNELYYRGSYELLPQDTLAFHTRNILNTRMLSQLYFAVKYKGKQLLSSAIMTVKIPLLKKLK